MINPLKIQARPSFILIFFSVINLTGCSGYYANTNTIQANHTVNATGFDPAQPSATYTPTLERKTFKPGDIATITMNGFEEFSGIYTVGSDGNILLGHIGAVTVAGKTVPEVQKNLRDQYSTCCLVNPNISVERDGQVFGKIVVDGAVNEAGVFEIDGLINLSEAIALAGGLDDIAKPELTILSREIEGSRRIATVNLNEIQKFGANDPVIYPNDIIFVQDDKGRQLYQDFVKTLPLVSAIILASTRR